jgi:hypothetical protein
MKFAFYLFGILTVIGAIAVYFIAYQSAKSQKKDQDESRRK